MSVTLVKRALPIRALGTVCLGAALVLAAGAAGAAAPLTAVAVAAGIASAVPGVALVCLGLAVRATLRHAGVCRCAGMLGLAVLAGGLTAVVLPVVDAVARPRLVAAGLTVVAALALLGLLRVPGVAATGSARLRLALDGFTIGTILALVGWLLLPGLATERRLAYAAVTVALTGTAIVVAAVVRAAATAQRPAMIRCGSGVALAIAGLALLVETVAPGAPPWGLFAATALVVAGPPVIWAGVRRVEFAPESAERQSGTTTLDESFGGFPMLAVPVAAGVLAAAYHLVVHGVPDRTAVCLAMVAAAALAAREVLAAVDLRRQARRLAEQGARLRALVAGTGDVTMVLSDDLVVSWQSPAARQLGLADRDVVGRRFTDLVHPDDAGTVAARLRSVLAGGGGAAPILVEARLVDGTGGWRETESTVSDLRQAPDVGGLVMQVRDVGQRRHLERVVHLLASTDQRTGLPNRQELLRAVTSRRAGGRRGAVVVIGLHGLSAVSDLRGRAAADTVLVEAAHRLRAHVGTEDVAARLGENQLAVVALAGPIEAYALGVQLVSALTAPYPMPDRPVQLQVNVGLAALSAGDAEGEAACAAEGTSAAEATSAAAASAEEVLRRGELALRRASRLGRNQVEWYDESLEEQLVRRLDLERHLPGAAKRGELDLVYQPVVELERRRPVGVEALLRWRHPVLGRVLPGELLPVADQLQVSGEIGEWVLHTACQQLEAWRQAGHDLWLAVNVTARQLTDAEFVPGVAAALSVHRSPPERLTIEISTGEVGGDLPAVASQLGKVRGLGVRTALDDVGTSHTDLTWLQRLPLDVVKLATPPAAAGADRLVAAVLEVGRRLGLAVVAKGLEAEAQRELVRRAGCRLGQGYLVSAPAPAERFEAYLDTSRGVEIRSSGSSYQ